LLYFSINLNIKKYFYFKDNILSDTALVENLETTKRTAAEIQQKVAEAKITSEKIDEAREHYRPAAARASLLYFILNELNTINLVYQFSLKVKNYQEKAIQIRAFTVVEVEFSGARRLFLSFKTQVFKNGPIY